MATGWVARSALAASLAAGAVCFATAAAACSAKGNPLPDGGLHMEIVYSAGTDSACGGVFVVNSAGQLAERPRHGSVTYDGMAQFRYVADPGFRGVDAFRLTGIRLGQPVFMTVGVSVQ